MAPRKTSFDDLGLSIIGIGVQYPPHNLGPDSLSTIARRFYPESASMSKVLSINESTGIKIRSSVITADSPLVNQETPPTISQIHDDFVKEGIPLAVEAAQQAINESNIQLADITHVVSTTCTDSSNPGFDHLVISALGLSDQVEKVLMQGVGCSGGLAALRTAANLALGHTARRMPARILCVALEICTTLVRSELDRINDLQETRIGATLFSDCASAVVLSNDIDRQGEPIYELLGWNHRIIPGTADQLRFDVDPIGWKVRLTPKVPQVTCSSILPAFSDLLTSIPSIPASHHTPDQFDWAIHPGGAQILAGAVRALDITPQHTRASRDIYENHGNSSSTTIFSVLDRLRHEEMDNRAPEGGPRSHVVGCAFGPGVAVESCMLKRNLRHSRVSQ